MRIQPVFCFPHLEKHAAPSENTNSGKALLRQETGQMGRGSWWAVKGVGGWGRGIMMPALEYAWGEMTWAFLGQSSAPLKSL